MALHHALRFPALQRLVYSTCSIHERENEAVVAAVLPAATAAGFHLVDPFPGWHRRGVCGALTNLELCQRLVRTDAYEDGTDGFFVAVFERQQHVGSSGGTEEEGKALGSAPQACIQANEQQQEQQQHSASDHLNTVSTLKRKHLKQALPPIKKTRHRHKYSLR